MIGISKKEQLRKDMIPYNSLHRKAWALFSAYVRQRDKGVCFTCGIRKHYKKMHAGHYMHGHTLDFDEMNINCQCVRCNMYLHGNLGIYGEKLIKKYGAKLIDAMRRRHNKGHKHTRQEMEDIIDKYGKKKDKKHKDTKATSSRGQASKDKRRIKIKRMQDL